MSKFHDDSMVNKSEIVVLPWQIWVYAGKEKAQWEGYFFHQRHYLENPNNGCVRKYVPNLVFKFHDDTTVNESKIVVLLNG